MLNLFHTNSKDRLIFILLLLIVWGLLSVYFLDFDTTRFSYYQAALQRAYQGKVPYIHTDDNLSIVFLYLIIPFEFFFGFGKSVSIVLQCLLTLFLVIQFNQTINSHLKGKESFLPGFILLFFLFILCGNVGLTPEYLGLFFSVFAFSYTLKSFSKNGTESDFFFAGLFFGFAIVFVPVFLFLGIAQLLFSIFYFSKPLSNYLSYVVGLFLPILLILLLFFLFGYSQDFIFFYLINNFYWDSFHFENLTLWQVVFILLTSFFVLYFFWEKISSPGVHQEVVYSYSQFIWLVLAGGIAFFYGENYSAKIILALPLAFFVSSVLKSKNKIFWFAEFYLLVLIAFWLYVHHRKSTFTENQVEIKEKRLWVVADDYEAYKNNIPTTPFLNYRLFQDYSQKLSTPLQLSIFMSDLMKEKPEVIYDPNKEFKKIVEKVPALEDYYQNEDKYWYIYSPIK